MLPSVVDAVVIESKRYATVERANAIGRHLNASMRDTRKGQKKTWSMYIGIGTNVPGVCVCVCGFGVEKEVENHAMRFWNVGRAERGHFRLKLNEALKSSLYRCEWLP